MTAVVVCRRVIRRRGTAIYENSWAGNAFWYGLGIALTIQALLILGADYFAEKRAMNYEILLKQKIENEVQK